jgi:hypothetical protein
MTTAISKFLTSLDLLQPRSTQELNFWQHAEQTAQIANVMNQYQQVRDKASLSRNTLTSHSQYRRIAVANTVRSLRGLTGPSKEKAPLG